MERDERVRCTSRRSTVDRGLWTAPRISRLVFLAFVFISMPAHAQQRIEFYDARTVSYPVASVHPYATDFQDTLAGDTLYQVRAVNGYPVSYHRKIKTSVCFDNKCRLLNIVVHWNITGRYLGFELPPGEFLSKAEHKPFVHEEYMRLHTLLADPNSPLAGFSYNELVPEKAAPNADIDAVSAATSKNLLEFVVEGAAYTTYKLWHIVHGTSQQVITQLTAEALTPELLADILESENISDKIWGLNQRHYVTESTAEVRDRVLAFIASDEYSLSERAIHAVSARDFVHEDFQRALVGIMDEVNYGLKKRIIQKFTDAPRVPDDVRQMLGEKLVQLDGVLVGVMLEMFREKHITDIEVCRKVAMLLQNDNVFISRQAFDFLNGLALEDKDIKAKVNRYKAKHSLK